MTRIAQHTALLLLMFAVLSACGGGATPFPTALPPTLTPTPRSTPLAPVATEDPLGSEVHPYQVILVPASSSSATGTDLAKFLNDRTGKTFKVQLATSASEVLSALCTGTPAFGWGDGWLLLAAQSENCGTTALLIKSNNSTGQRAEIVTRAIAKITTLSGLKDRDFCRINSQDIVSWVLPAIMMRGAGFSPFSNLKSVREYPDTASMLQAVADGTCQAAAIPAGTLNQFKVTDKSAPADITKLITTLTTSPEVPLGGMVVSAAIPKEVSDTVAKVFMEHPEAWKDLITADELVKADSSTLAETQKFVQSAGINFASLGR
jgi:ABC-type phosphate/phosphonate transport system substrate-binding protein